MGARKSEPGGLYGMLTPVELRGEAQRQRAIRNFYGEPPPGQPETLEEQARKWLHGRMNRVLADRDFARAVREIAKSLKLPFPERALSLFLAFLAVHVMAGRGAHRKGWEVLWAAGAGKTWKALKEFPGRLRGMADEVERLNASPFFAPAQYVNAKTLKAEIVKKRFYQLPGIMRVYAAALEAHIERVPQAFPPRPRGHPPALFDLSEAVKVVTGRYCDRQVADLLNASASALGEEKQFDALSIAQARSRRRKKAKT